MYGILTLQVTQLCLVQGTKFKIDGILFVIDAPLVDIPSEVDRVFIEGFILIHNYLLVLIIDYVDGKYYNQLEVRIV